MADLELALNLKSTGADALRADLRAVKAEMSSLEESELKSWS